MDSGNEKQSTEHERGLRERIGRRGWARPAALVASGLIVGGIVAGTVAANAVDDRPAHDSSTSREDGRPGHGGGHRGPHGDRADSSSPLIPVAR